MNVFSRNFILCAVATFWAMSLVGIYPVRASPLAAHVWTQPAFSGAPLTYFNDGGGIRQRFIFYTPKNPNFRICLSKKIPNFFSIPKKIPQCFCISKFYYLSSGKLKHANFNFGFGQKQNYTKTNTKKLA